MGRAKFSVNDIRNYSRPDRNRPCFCRGCAQRQTGLLSALRQRMLRNSIESDLEYVNSSLQLWTKYSDEQMIRSFRQRQERLYRELKYCIRKFNRE